MNYSVFSNKIKDINYGNNKTTTLSKLLNSASVFKYLYPSYSFTPNRSRPRKMEISNYKNIGNDIFISPFQLLKTENLRKHLTNSSLINNKNIKNNKIKTDEFANIINKFKYQNRINTENNSLNKYSNNKIKFSKTISKYETKSLNTNITNKINKYKNILLFKNFPNNGFVKKTESKNFPSLHDKYFSPDYSGKLKDLKINIQNKINSNNITPNKNQNKKLIKSNSLFSNTINIYELSKTLNKNQNNVDQKLQKLKEKIIKSTERCVTPNKINIKNYNLNLTTNFSKNKKILVLDLDETLVHSSFNKFPFKSDIIINIPIENNKYRSIHILKRPYVNLFLEKMSKIFKIIIFTSSVSSYAKRLLPHLDTNKKISNILTREKCTNYNGVYVKDLKKISRNLKDIIIIDNNPLSFLLNKENGLPIKTWHFDKCDTELLRFIPLLEYLAKVNDVRNTIKKIVVNDVINFNIVNEIIHKNEETNTIKKSISNKNNLVFSPKINTKGENFYFNYYLKTTNNIINSDLKNSNKNRIFSKFPLKRPVSENSIKYVKLEKNSNDGGKLFFDKRISKKNRIDEKYFYGRGDNDDNYSNFLNNNSKKDYIIDKIKLRKSNLLTSSAINNDNNINSKIKRKYFFKNYL